MKKQTGFTMIELIVVIVILGILGAVALPRFLDFTAEASNAAVVGVAGAVSSGSAVNYAAAALGRTNMSPFPLNGARATVCTTANMGALLTSGMPTSGGSYTAAPATTGNATCVAGGSVTCVISFDPTGSAPAVNANAEITCY